MRFIILLLIGACIFFALEFYHFAFDVVQSPQNQSHFEITPGSTLTDVENSLKQKNHLKHSRFFMLMARLSGASHNIKAGEYVFEPDITPRRLLRKLVAGDVLLRQFTIIEGWNKYDLLHALHDNPYLKHDLHDLNDAQITARLAITEPTLEGLFFPETYTFAKHSSESEILRNAYTMMHRKLSSAWIKRAKKLPYRSAYEALIVASMIEKETASTDERVKVAGVIVRRLHKKMLLQIDPTVRYGLNKASDIKLSKNDLRYKTPYNTYLLRGLPPTPIAMPSSASIQAALHPDESDALYFVANGEGKHIFSKNLAAHNHAVAHLRRKQEKKIE